MLTEKEIESFLEKIVGGTEEKMVAELNERVISSFVKDGELVAKDWQALDDLVWANQNAVYGIVDKYSAQISKEVMSGIQDALWKSDANSYKLLSSVYDNIAPPGSSEYFKLMSQQTAIGVSEVVARNNVFMAQRANSLWYKISGEAITRANHGLVDMDTIINDAIKQFSKLGIDRIQYAKRSDQIDVALKRHMRTQINQAAGRINLERIQDAGHDLVQTTCHGGARPEHEAWQGKAFCLSGEKEIDGVKYPDFYAVTGYGTVTGIMGANCRHFFDMYFPGITELPELPETLENGMTNEEYYEATQQQRYLERQIRKTKSEINVLEIANARGVSNNYLIVNARLSLGKQQAALNAFCTINGMTRIPKREKAYGIGKQPMRLLKRPSNIVIGRSLGAAAFKDSVKIPKRLTGLSSDIKTKITEGSRITGIAPIAGRGSSTRIKGELPSLLKEFPETKESDWVKKSGKGYIDDLGLSRHVELHWYESRQTGRVRMKVKKYL